MTNLVEYFSYQSLFSFPIGGAATKLNSDHVVSFQQFVSSMRGHAALKKFLERFRSNFEIRTNRTSKTSKFYSVLKFRFPSNCPFSEFATIFTSSTHYTWPVFLQLKQKYAAVKNGRS